jgi:hypothetical protein
VTNDRKNISQQLTLRKLYNNWERRTYKPTQIYIYLLSNQQKKTEKYQKENGLVSIEEDGADGSFPVIGKG